MNKPISPVAVSGLRQRFIEDMTVRGFTEKIRVERGKGGRYRHAMLSADLLSVLRAWWQEGRRRGVMLPGGWLFPSQDPSKPITTRQLSRVVEDAAQTAGITKHVSPHTLRHSFATHLLENAAAADHLADAHVN